MMVKYRITEALCPVLFCSFRPTPGCSLQRPFSGPRVSGPTKGATARPFLIVKKNTFNGPLTLLAFNWCFYSLIFLAVALVRSFACLMCACCLLVCWFLCVLSLIPFGLSAFFWRFFSPCLVFSHRQCRSEGSQPTALR